MALSIRPGETLAGRYRLDDLLTESAGGRFWRAHDFTLARSVAVHVILADDPRAPGLLEAARRSVSVTDKRFLRVLDADQRDGVCYVVNEWGEGSSLDILLASDGALAPRAAAWIVAEAAAALAVAHDAGVTHGRLVPEHLLLDQLGRVRVIGLAVDAALAGLPPGSADDDVTDLVGCLYAGLTARWTGHAASVVPPALREAGAPLRPRRVRAGVPRPLDELCAEVFDPAPVGTHARVAYDWTTARGVADYLRAWLGRDAEPAELRDLLPRGRTTQVTLPDEVSRTLPGDEPDGSASTAPAEATAPPSPQEAAPAWKQGPGPGLGVEHVAPGDPVGTPLAPAAVGPDASSEPEPPAEQPTQAGIPVFEDSGDVGWISRDATPPSPPPPLPELPPRPLFAPEPPAGTPARKRRPNAGADTPAGEYWPWDGTHGGTGPLTRTGPQTRTGTGTGPIVLDDEEPVAVPGRRSLRLAIIIAAVAGALLATMVIVNLVRGKAPLSLGPSEPSTSRSQSTGAGGAVAPLTGLTADDLDPQADPPEESPQLTPLAVDGDPATDWHTSTYKQNLGPGGLKTGVGLVIDLKRSVSVASVELTLVGAPSQVALYLGEEPPTTVEGLTPFATETAPGTQLTLTPDQPVTGRYLTVWFTSLPAVSGGYRGGIAEVVVRA